MTDDACYYCDKPIGDAPCVKGDKADAHRACVHERLDGINPHWREHIQGESEESRQ